MVHVIGIVREAGGGFRLSLPDFPGLVAEGATLSAAVSRAAEEVAGRFGGPDMHLRSVDVLAVEEADRMAQGTAVLVPVPFQANPARQVEGEVEGEALPGQVPPTVGQVPLSGQVSANEEPTAKAKAKAETAGAAQRSTDALRSTDDL